jgi:hypothetical protein
MNARRRFLFGLGRMPDSPSERARRALTSLAPLRTASREAAGFMVNRPEDLLRLATVARDTGLPVIWAQGPWAEAQPGLLFDYAPDYPSAAAIRGLLGRAACAGWEPGSLGQHPLQAAQVLLPDGSLEWWGEFGGRSNRPLASPRAGQRIARAFELASAQPSGSVLRLDALLPRSGVANLARLLIGSGGVLGVPLVLECSPGGLAELASVASGPAEHWPRFGDTDRQLLRAFDLHPLLST